MSKFNAIIAVHHEIIVEADTEEQAQEKAKALIDDVFPNAFDTEHVACDEVDEGDVTTVNDLRGSINA